MSSYCHLVRSNMRRGDFALQVTGCNRVYMGLHERRIKSLVNPADCLISLLSVGFETDALFLVQCVCVSCSRLLAGETHVHVKRFH